MAAEIPGRPVREPVPPLGSSRDYCILLLLPVGNDSVVARKVLSEAGYLSEASRDIEEICRGMQEGAGAVVLSEEVLTPPARERLLRALAQQPPWSDMPLIVLTAGSRSGIADALPGRNAGSLGNATVLERPLRIATLLQSVKVALNSRRRQYETREYLHEREQVAVERLAQLEKQRAFVKDVLLSVTEGKLHLCNDERDLPHRAPACGASVELTARTLRDMRQQVLHAADRHGMDTVRAEDFVTGVGEAAMNAVVHAGGGVGSVGITAEGALQVWIEDHGTGIDMARLPRATLERGFSSAGTLGHGFWLLLKFCDRVHILTGLGGTTVVLELDREPPRPAWMDFSGGL